MLQQYTTPEIPAWLAKPPGVFPRMDDKEDRVRITAPDGWEWTSNPGPQTWVLLCPYDEALIGGRRGGSKSAALIAWMTQGDSSLDPDDPARLSFLNEPSFRGLLLRKEYQGMAEFIDECAEFFSHFGGKAYDDPVVFKFKSGAKIYTNHLGTADAFEKYRGQGITRIGIEELTQIEDEKRYLKLFGSLRNKKQVRRHKIKGKWRVFPKLHCQILNTTNPDGAGKIWVKNRFVKVPSAKGGYIPANFPMVDPITRLTRIYIPMKREDNPYLRDDQQYEGMLLSQDEVTRRQWMDGDWDAQGGLFFDSYRPNGPVGSIESERYPWARHVPAIKPKLQPWWLRWGSIDIGYDHPTIGHKWCRNQDDKRLHVYDEFWARKMDSYELGVAWAQWWLPDLEQLPDHQIVTYLSPDAFSKTDADKTKAERFELGIKEILGPYGAVLLRFNEAEREHMLKDPERAKQMFQQRREQFQGKMGIAIKMANDNLKDGCSFMRELFRFRPVVTETEEQLEQRLLMIYGTAGLEAYEKARSKAGAVSAREILPKLQIWPECIELDRCLKEAERDEEPKTEQYKKFNAIDGVGGDDAVDCCFIAGTLVQMSHGRAPIESISVGDLVETRAGLRPVKAARLTRELADVFTVRFSNGESLTGTAEHPIWVHNSGWTRLDALRYGDMVEGWQSKPSFSTALNSGDIQNPITGICGSISGLAGTIGSGGLDHFIRKYGAHCMERFRRGIISTTKMATRLTTTATISLQNLGSIISRNMHVPMRLGPECGYSLKLEDLSLRLGTVQRPDWPGIVSMVKPLQPEERRCLISACNAGLDSPLKEGIQSSAKTLVNRSGEGITTWTRLKRNASSVVRYFLPTSMTRYAFVPAHVVAVTPAGKAPVYNLAVSDVHEYYANGVLVHNCRYGAMGYKDLQIIMPREYFVEQKMTEIQALYTDSFGAPLTDPTRLAMIAMTQNANYDKLTAVNRHPINLPRQGSQRHRPQGRRVN